jgi:tRNA modification GTPase
MRETSLESTSDSCPIAAIASGYGASAIAVIRVSGGGCHKLLAPMLRRHGQSVGLSPRAMTLCDFVDPSTQEIIDSPLAAFFPGPNSFTGEDSVEIFVHGSPYISRRCLEALLNNGIRAADPGEFSRRAFLNGKLDLTQAEGIKALCEAQTKYQWQAAQCLTSGSLAQDILKLRQQLIEAMAWLEARIDFPDEAEPSAVEWKAVDERVGSVEKSLEALLATYSQGRVATEGLRVALIGKPNAGKSSLMNQLLRTERAIVTEIPGTTRDYLEESCLIKGRLIRLIDTAGLRTTEEAVEKIGIDRAKLIAKGADLVLILVAADIQGEDLEEMKVLAQEFSNIHFVLTKADLGVPPWAETFLPISCLTGQGMDLLEDFLQDAMDHFVQDFSEHSIITNVRHKCAIEESLGNLKGFRLAREARAYEEMLAYELQSAAKSLTSVIGDIENDDILDVIFSQFCIGK